MYVYSRNPVRAAWQALGDAFLVFWCLGWSRAGQLVHDSVATLAQPVRQLQSAGASYDATFDDLGERVSELPLVGGQLADAFRAASTPGDTISADAANLAAQIDRNAALLGSLTTWLPILLFLVPWLVLRIRFVLRAVENTRLARRPGSRSLLALRALSHRPVRELMTIAADPADAWRRGDPEVVDRLVALEIRDSGARPPKRAAVRGPQP